MISGPLAKGLLRLVELMEGETEPWWIIGSTAMVLGGVDGIEPDDIDVAASGPCLLRALARAGRPVAEPRFHAKFRSSPYQRIDVAGGKPIEVMGGLQVHDGNAFVPLALKSRLAVQVGTATCFIPSMSEQIGVFSLFGRPKDLAKAERLRQLV